MPLEMTCQMYLHIYGREFTTFLEEMYVPAAQNHCSEEWMKQKLGESGFLCCLFTLQMSLMHT